MTNLTYFVFFGNLKYYKVDNIKSENKPNSIVWNTVVCKPRYHLHKMFFHLFYCNPTWNEIIVLPFVLRLETISFNEFSCYFRNSWENIFFNMFRTRFWHRFTLFSLTKTVLLFWMFFFFLILSQLSKANDQFYCSLKEIKKVWSWSLSYADFFCQSIILRRFDTMKTCRWNFSTFSWFIDYKKISRSQV